MKRISFLWKYIFESKKENIRAFFILILFMCLSIMPGLIIKDIFDVGIISKDYTRIIVMSFALLFTYTTLSYLNYKATFMLSVCSNKVVTAIRDDVIERIIKLPMDFFSLHDSGYITARIGEVNNISSFISVNTIKVIVSILQFFGVLVMLMCINPLLTIILVVVTPVFYFAGRFNSLKMAKVSASAIEQSAKLSNKIQESMQGIEEIKNLSVEEREVRKIKLESDKLLSLGIKQTNSYTYGSELLSYLGKLMVVILVLCGSFLILNNFLTIGEYMIFSSYLAILYAPMQSLALLSITLMPAMTSLDRIMEFVNETNEDDCDDNKSDIANIYNIEFRNLSFKYKKQKNNLISNMSFSIGSKEKMMIKGGNGSGKTTILRLILGLYPCSGGAILFNNIDSTRISKTCIRKRISVVSQKIYLFSGTIEDNIRYGSELPDDAFGQKMNKILSTGILDQIPIDSGVSVRGNGCNLSGGQIQRIALARGLLKDADVFLFDEPTTGLDLMGINAIKTIIKDLLSEKICIFVEHNGELDELCDKEIDLS